MVRYVLLYIWALRRALGSVEPPARVPTWSRTMASSSRARRVCDKLSRLLSHQYPAYLWHPSHFTSPAGPEASFVPLWTRAHLYKQELYCTQHSGSLETVLFSQKVIFKKEKYAPSLKEYRKTWKFLSSSSNLSSKGATVAFLHIFTQFISIQKQAALEIPTTHHGFNHLRSENMWGKNCACYWICRTFHCSLNTTG